MKGDRHPFASEQADFWLLGAGVASYWERRFPNPTRRGVVDPYFLGRFHPRCRRRLRPLRYRALGCGAWAEVEFEPDPWPGEHAWAARTRGKALRAGLWSRGSGKCGAAV